MIYITQLIFLIPGQEDIFDRFEDIAILIISKYNGRLLLRIRPDDNAFIEHHSDKPYEIHPVEFDTEHDFENFKQDEERKRSFAGSSIFLPDVSKMSILTWAFVGD